MSGVGRALLHELAEALTAIEGYVAGAQHLSNRSHGENAQIAGVLERLADQAKRAADAVRQLQALPGLSDTKDRTA